MKRFGRPIFYAAAIMSAVLCAITLALWIRSGFVSDRFFYWRFKHEGTWLYWTEGQIVTGEGGIGFTSDTHALPSTWGPGMIQRIGRFPHHESQAPLYPNFYFDRSKAFWGFSFRHLRTTSRGNEPPGDALRIVVPLWCPVLVFAIATIPGLRLWRKRKRRGEGLCRQCGYDLRATPERCPECGAVPAGADVMASKKIAENLDLSQ